jgi:hypothetical protein
MSDTDISTITIDDIAFLKASGRGYEAKQLLEQYHKNKRENKEQLIKELNKQNYQKKKIKKLRDSKV